MDFDLVIAGGTLVTPGGTSQAEIIKLSVEFRGRTRIPFGRSRNSRNSMRAEIT
jgi:hypothetical protein